jgi:hypothetical protein
VIETARRGEQASGDTGRRGRAEVDFVRGRHPGTERRPGDRDPSLQLAGSWRTTEVASVRTPSTMTAMRVLSRESRALGGAFRAFFWLTLASVPLCATEPRLGRKPKTEGSVQEGT